MSGPRTHRLAATAVLVVAVSALTGCTKNHVTSVPLGSFGLVAFDSCADALAGLRTAAKASIGAYGMRGTGGVLEDSATAQREATGAAPPNAPNAASAGDAAKGSDPGATTYSGTNTHESGVDEPDLVKTDGKRIVTISGGLLRIVDAASRRVTGTVNLADASGGFAPYTGDILLAGNHALVLVDNQVMTVDSATTSKVAAPGYAVKDPGADVVQGPSLILVDLNAAKVLSRARIDGGLVDARQVGSIARVVLRSSPRFPFTPPPPNATIEQQVAANQAVIDAAGIEAWTPRIDVTTGGTTKRSQVDCASISRPASYSATNMLTVLTLDLNAGALSDGQPVSIVADGDTVYSNGTSLYVASNQAWRAAAPMAAGAPAKPVEPTTEIYKFDVATPARPTFLAGGSVPGHLINQYAMSEWDGKLRVATTTDAVLTNGGQPAASQSGVYVLGQDGEALKNVGAIDGIGKGERIYAVRFVGTTGYVVTFRQTDPLYTVDISDPTRPVVKGELKIPGYSAYLHPAEGSRLIGIGQDATDQGRVTGTQVSLFDVADLTNPARLAQYKLAGAYSEAEFEPHAFLYWPADGLLVVPLQGRGTVATNGTARIAANTGALVLRVNAGGISQVGFVSHPALNGTGYAAPIRRSLIIDSTLWTVSDAGLLASDRNSLAKLTWIPFV